MAAALLALVLTGATARAGEAILPAPGERDKCPVCGMFVKAYPEWTAAVVYRDGHAHYFDGAKDLFKFLAGPTRYAPQHRADEVSGVVVTEYYGLSPIDARDALFVVGSDVLGPMGRELVPLADAPAAGEFVKDHGGRTLRFDEVTAAVLKELDPPPQ
jgi:nitrous oxide reductase accessory protein NosL